MKQLTRNERLPVPPDSRLSSDVAELYEFMALQKTKAGSQEQLSESVATWPYTGYDSHVAVGSVYETLGYDAILTYSVGGQDPDTVLWANMSASKEHVGLIRSLDVEVYDSFLWNMLIKMSSGDTSRHYPYGKLNLRQLATIGIPEAAEASIFATALVNQAAQGRGVYAEQLRTFEDIREQGIRPLNFEQLGGLAMRCIHETLQSHPELSPPSTVC